MAPRATPKEIRGWLLYDVANGAYFFGVLSFLPLLVLDQGAEIAHRTVCTSRIPNVTEQDMELTTFKCNESGIPVETEWCTCLLNTTLWKRTGRFGHEEFVPENSQVLFLGLVPMTFTTLWSSGIAASVCLQLIVFLLFSSAGDFGALRKTILLLGNTIGGVCCLIIGFIGGSYSQASLDLIVLCAIVSNLMMGFAVVMYSAYLPLLVDSTPEVLEASLEGRAATKEQVESRLSSQGIRAGFAGQILFLLIAGAGLATGVASLHILVLCGGVWVLAIGTYAIASLEQRPGRPLPHGTNLCQASTGKLKDTCGKRSRLPQLFVFLAAYLIYSDGTSTCLTQAPIMASAEFGASSAAVVGMIIILSLSAIVGALIAMQIQLRFHITPKKLLIASLFMQSLLPSYAMFATTIWELFMAASVFGLATGPASAYTRSIFSSCLPKGHEAEFFGFFQVTDKGTAWAGPILLTAVANAFSFRLGYASLVLFYWLGIPILCMFQHPEAVEQKVKFESFDGSLQDEVTEFHETS